MQWLNEPASWQRNGDVLKVSVDPGTDFWRTTGYGYVHDNGHVYGDRLPGDLDVSVRVRGAFASQYDQAGIMLRADEETWLKTGLEFFEGRPRLSTVLTMGRSSWMVADLPPGTDEVTLRVSRRGDAVEVRCAAGDGAAELAALVFMPPGLEVLAGVMCAAPAGTGFSVSFHDLRIVGRAWSGQAVPDGAGWAGESAARADGWASGQAAGTGAGWADEAPAWADEPAGELAVGWDADEADAAEPGWDRDKPAEVTGDWRGDRPGDRVAGWDADEAGAAEAGGARDKAGGARDKAGGARDKAGGARDKAGAAEAGGARDKPGKTAAGPPAWWDDELPGDESLDWARPEESLDWAKPQASEPAADWDKLSLSLTTTSWNAFAAAKPAEEEPAGPAPEQASHPAADPAAGRASRAHRDREGRPGEPPEPPAGDEATPARSAAARPEQAEPEPDETARGKNGRGRNKAKQHVPPALPPPADPADEWISLLTADSAEELSGPGPAGELSEPARERADGGQDRG